MALAAQNAKEDERQPPRPLRIVWLDVRASYSHSSLALPLLHAASRGRITPEPEWRAVAATINDSPAAVAARVAAEQPDVLAGTAYLFTRDLLLAVVRRVKALRPECTVILGGPEFLGDNETFLRREPAVDCVLRGEAELAFPKLLAWLGGCRSRIHPNPSGECHRHGFLLTPGVAECADDGARDWCDGQRVCALRNSEIKTTRGSATLRGCWGSGEVILADDSPNLQVEGLCRLDDAGAYWDHGAAALSAAEFAALPPPSASPFFDWGKPFIQLETSRGCANECAFCTSGGVPLRLLPLEQVRERLAEIRARGMREVRVLDRTFNADPRRACALLALFRDLCPETRFHLELHPAWMTEELRETLRGFPAGKLHLEVGLQTMNPAALAACNRRGDMERTLDGLAFLCGLRNLAVHVDLLAGLPEVTRGGLFADLEKVTRLGPEEIQLETLKLLPGTPLAADAARLGIAAAPDAPYEVLRTPQMTPEELLEARLLSRLVDGFHNAAALRGVVRAAVEQLPDFYASFLAELRRTPVLEAPTSLETRFGLLHAFLAARERTLAECAEIAWMEAGLSPARCPGGRAKPWTQPLPAEAILVSRAESAPAALSRNAHVWLLEHGSVRRWFIFDRAVSPTRPAAVYHNGG